MEARNFQKTAEELESAARNRNFWAGSPKCLLLCGGGVGISAVLYFVIRALIFK
jgi:hypothetical protein